MALSNIFREPRREIVETVIGLALIIPTAWADYVFGCWLQDYAGCEYVRDEVCKAHTVPWVIGMIIGPVLVMMLMGASILVHALGESVCDRLARSDIHLRPRRRY